MSKKRSSTAKIVDATEKTGATQSHFTPWPADKVERWTIDRVKPYPRNARTHSPEQIELIAESIREFGFAAPLLVDESGVLIYGHGRFAAANLLDLKEVPVMVAVNWTEQQKAAYRITDNQLALRSDWNQELLRSEVTELSISEYPLEILGFENPHLEWLANEPLALDPVEEWGGMPEFEQPDKPAFRSVVVHFKDQAALDDFIARTGLPITDKSKFVWFPEIEIISAADVQYKAE